MASTYLGKPYYPPGWTILPRTSPGRVARGMAPFKAPRPSMKSWSPPANYTSFRSFTRRSLRRQQLSRGLHVSGG